ncbi:hypothetical protein GGR51DRAFT_333331 [Nemania sp. FL0031]|nr:hypothetical protein GGR51DRAFT_333331 [Nemania sp. FL0031]
MVLSLTHLKVPQHLSFLLLQITISVSAVQNWPITHPVAGSVVPAGQPCAIEWAPSTAGPVSITLYNDTGRSIITSSTANDGWYSWTPTLWLAGYDYYLQICDNYLDSDECSYTSDGRFRISYTSGATQAPSSLASPRTTLITTMSSNRWPGTTTSLGAFATSCVYTAANNETFACGSGDGGGQSGSTVGIVVGVVVTAIVIGIAVAVFFCLRSRSRNGASTAAATAPIPRAHVSRATRPEMVVGI